jgi:hypothetical protein
MSEQEKAINDAGESTNADSCQLDTVVIPPTNCDHYISFTDGYDEGWLDTVGHDKSPMYNPTVKFNYCPTCGIKLAV